MPKFAISFWIWMPAVMRASLFAFVTMTGAFMASTEKLTTAASVDWGWIEWGRFFFPIVAAGAGTVIAFLDQSMTFIRNKVGDTQLFSKE